MTEGGADQPIQVDSFFFCPKLNCRMLMLPYPNGVGVKNDQGVTRQEDLKTDSEGFAQPAPPLVKKGKRRATSSATTTKAGGAGAAGGGGGGRKKSVSDGRPDVASSLLLQCRICHHKVRANVPADSFIVHEIRGRSS